MKLRYWSALIFGSAFLLILAFSWFELPALPSYKWVRSQYLSSDRLLLDRQGRPVHESRIDDKVRRLSWVNYDRVSPLFKSLLIQAEDKRFYSHFGLDPLAFLSAIKSGTVGGKLRGASTLTMQLTPLLRAPGFQAKFVKKGFWLKWQQIMLAVKLEMYWSKQEIFEAYMNLVQYKGELQGIAAASYGLFEKSPDSLTELESAILAALIRAPNASVAEVSRRTCELMNADRFACESIERQVVAKFNHHYFIAPVEKLAPFIAKKAWALNKQARTVQTTLDLEVQKLATSALQRQISQYRSQNMNDGGVLVVENKTGHIVAYVGNIGAASTAPHVDAVMARRQAGSTLKSFLFGLAFQQKLMTPATVLRDSPLEIGVQSGLYKPYNYDRSYREWVSTRQTLASSLNIPSVRALELVGVDSFVWKLQELGFEGLERPEFYGPSLALGSADIRLYDLVNAYRTFANDGVWSPITWNPDEKLTGAHRVYSEQAAFLIKDILSDRESRASTFGLENMLSTSFWTAAKTGTSKDMRDNWCVGFSEKYTVGVWVGNFAGSPMWNVSGIHGAAPVWMELMNHLHKTEPSRAPQVPAGMVQKQVRFSFDRTQRQEWFIAGTEPNQELVTVGEDAATRLIYPVNQTLVAIDPDIPRKNQKMFFQVQNPSRGDWLRLNGKRIARAGEFVSWQPKLGIYKLEVVSAKNQVIDQVQFQVRGRQYVQQDIDDVAESSR